MERADVLSLTSIERLLIPTFKVARGEQLVPIDELGSTGSTTPPITSDVSTTHSRPFPVPFKSNRLHIKKKDYKGSPLDKDLPPKPILRARDSPERRGLVDALDTDRLNLEHPVLESELSFLASDSESPDEDSPGSFKVTPSLDTPSTIGAVDTGTAVIVEGRMASANAISAIPVRTPNYGSPVERV